VITLPARLRGRRLEWIGTAIVLAIATWYWLRYFNRSTNLLDEGSTAAQALRVLNGELIYRDFFTVVTPGSYYTVAWLFGLFGEQLIVLRWAALVTGIGIVFTTLLVARHIVSWPFAAAAALMTTAWGWFLGAPNFYSLEAGLLSLVALACYLHGAPSPRWLIAAGVATGCAAMVKQNIGAYAAAGLFITIWASMLFDRHRDLFGRLKMSAQFVAGICVPAVPTLLWLIVSGAGPYLYESWVYYPFTRYPERFARPFPAFFPFAFDEQFEGWTKIVIYLPVLVLPLAIAAIGILSWRFQRRADMSAKREGHALLAITAVGGLTLLQAWPRADVTHILFGLHATYILLAYACYNVWRLLATIPGPRAVVSGVAMIIAMVPLAILLRQAQLRTDWEYQNYVAPLRAERAKGISTGFVEAQRIDTVTRYVTEHTAPDDYVFVVPWASGFNFLTDRANPTRTDFMLFEDTETYPCLLARLDARPAKYVIYGYTWDVDDKRFRDYAAPVDQYIRTRYAIEFSTDGYEVWRRLDDAPAAAAAFPRACQPRPFRFRDLFR
jgi:hypothetical protein